MVRRLVNNELERMWKEAVTMKYEILSHDLPEDTEEKHKNLSA
jgi:hypothetical protein